MSATRETTRAEYLLMMARDMKESVLVTRIVNHAVAMGWRVMHQRPAMERSGKWSTALQGHKGFPDLVLSAPAVGRVMFVECKSHTGSLEPEQKAWRDTLLAAGADWRLWRPMDWLGGDIQNVIERVED